MPLRHKKSHDLSNAPQQKPVLEQKQEKQKNWLCSKFFFFAYFLSMWNSFCMKVTFSQVCKKSWLFAPTLCSLVPKNENDFGQKKRKYNILL